MRILPISLRAGLACLLLFGRPDLVHGAGGGATLPWDVVKLRIAPEVFPATESVDSLFRSPKTIATVSPPLPEVKALCFQALPWHGKPTRVFALYGAPAGANAGHKVPGVILLHGAGGTAFVDWVRLWISRGYAAIAFDEEGQVPIGSYGHWQSQPDGGPHRSDVADLKNPVADQWMYHAVADALLAHSLLASFPEVDASRIGIIGISWGAVIASVAAGVDDRLKFAVPVYGCGFISDPADDGSQFVGHKAAPEKAAEWRKVWDPANFLPQARLPMLWVAGMTDFAFTPNARQKSILAAPGPQTLSLRPSMFHAHNGPGETPPEIAAFADSIVRSGIPLAQISPPKLNGPIVAAAYQSVAPLTKATLNFTRDGGAWQQRKWEFVPAETTARQVSAPLPQGATACYFTLTDNRGLLITSEYLSPQASSGK